MSVSRAGGKIDWNGWYETLPSPDVARYVPCHLCGRKLLADSQCHEKDIDGESHYAHSKCVQSAGRAKPTSSEPKRKGTA